MTKTDKAFEKWYHRRFPEMMRKRTPTWISEIDARDSVLERQYHEIRRLKAKLGVAKFELQDLTDHVQSVHKCDFTCQHITLIAPIETPFFAMAPKVKASATYHSWMLDKLSPYVPEQQMGWWWKKPYAWLLALKRRLSGNQEASK